MGQAKRNNTLRRFSIFFILTCSFLFTAFIPIPFSKYLSANAQLLSVSNLSSPLVVDASCLLFNATSVLEYRPGTKNNGIPIEPPHNNPDYALGSPEGSGTPNYVSLGLHDLGEDTGTIILGIDLLPEEYAIVQLEVVDEPNGVGNCTDSPENIAVSIAGDNGSWQSLGTGCQTHTFSVNPPLAFRYVRIQDISDRTLFPEGEDGYDLDGIVVTACRILPTVVATPTYASTDTPTLAPPLPTETPTAAPTLLPTSTLTAIPSVSPTPTSDVALSPSSTPLQTGTSLPVITTSIPSATPLAPSNITPTPTIGSTPGIATLTSTMASITSPLATTIATVEPSQVVTAIIAPSSTSTSVSQTQFVVEPSNTPYGVSMIPIVTSTPLVTISPPLTTETTASPIQPTQADDFTRQITIEILGGVATDILYLIGGAGLLIGITPLIFKPRNPDRIKKFIDLLEGINIFTPANRRIFGRQLSKFESKTMADREEAIKSRDQSISDGKDSLPQFKNILGDIRNCDAKLDVIRYILGKCGK